MAFVAATRETPAEGVTGLTSRQPIGETVIELTASAELGDSHLVLANYLPVTTASDKDRRWIGYLDHPDATPHLGDLPFDRWWNCWLSLNAVAKHWLRDYDPPASTDADNPAERERLRLTCEAHNLGMVEVDRDRLHHAIRTMRTSDRPSAAESTPSSHH